MEPEKLLRILARTDVTEVALQSGRLPCAMVEGTLKPFGNTPLTIDDITRVLEAMGGRLHLASVAVQPARWSIDDAKAGTVNISAKYIGDMLQVRFRRPASVAKKSASATGAPSVAKRSVRPPPPSPSTRAASARGARDVAIPRSPLPPRMAAANREEHAKALGEMSALASALPPPPTTRRSRSKAPPPDAEAKTRTGASVRPPDTRHSIAPAVHAAPSAPRAPDKLDALLALARDLRASDLHVIAGRPPLVRIGGDLLPRGEVLSAEQVEKLVLSRVPERVRGILTDEGSCDFAMQHAKLGRFRANVSLQRTGYKMSVRLIPSTVPTLASLGLPDAIQRSTQHHQGLIVVSGPTGHGKTTTLAAIVDILNREHSHHIVTVEDPIEFVHPRRRSVMSQREVGTHTRTFASALKAALREDPDVIVVGELRDTETTRMAIAASETGHLVLSTMSTSSGAKTIDRLIDMFPPADQMQVRMTLAGGLRLIVSQRLVPAKDEMGLVPAVELLPGMPALWNLIRDNRTFQIPSLQQRGKSMGIVRLDDSLAQLVRSGKITAENAREFCDSPEELEALIAGRAFLPPEALAAQQAAAAGGGGLMNRAGNMFGTGPNAGARKG